MTRMRFVAATAVAFIVSQILTIAIHGFLLAADYAPFYGTLLRPMATEGSWRLLLLPFAHLCFVTILVWLYGRTRLEGGRFARGLKLKHQSPEQHLAGSARAFPADASPRVLTLLY